MKQIQLALQLIRKYPDYTIHEIDYEVNNRRLGCRLVGRQLFDLIDQNLIKPAGIKYCTISGNKSITWKINNRVTK